MVKNSLKELKWAQGLSRDTFRRMGQKRFLRSYVWVVYAAGFKVAILEQKFPALQKAFQNFNLKKLSRMESITPVLSVFNNERKARCVLRGARVINGEGFNKFKKRILDLREEGLDALDQLPGIGKITKNHLARDIGLGDVAKPDIWLQRLVKLFSANNHLQMTQYLAKTFGEKCGVVDVILWRFCADNVWKSCGCPSLEAFVKE